MVRASDTLRAEVEADPTQLAWAAAERWRDGAAARGARLELAPPGPAGHGKAWLRVVPIHRLAAEVPAMSTLELPFLFRSIDHVHAALDGALGGALRGAAAAAGWRLLAVWDEGLESLSGFGAYHRPENLAGIEFVLLRQDPIGEAQFRALDSWTRGAHPPTLAQIATECLVSSRSATLQQIAREELARVHLAVTVSRHRYAGWAVVASAERWEALPSRTRSDLLQALASVTRWERAEAARREDAALAGLKAAGMDVRHLDAATWDAYAARMGAREAMLPRSVGAVEGRRLVRLAAGAGH